MECQVRLERKYDAQQRAARRDRHVNHRRRIALGVRIARNRPAVVKLIKPEPPRVYAAPKPMPEGPKAPRFVRRFGAFLEVLGITVGA